MLIHQVGFVLLEISYAKPIQQSRLLNGRSDPGHQSAAQPLRTAGTDEPVSLQAGSQSTDPGRGAQWHAQSAAYPAFPLGTVDTFGTYIAPADFNETVNTLGQVLYAKQEPRKFERGTDLHTQSNPLPMCHRPGVLVKLTMA